MSNRIQCFPSLFNEHSKILILGTMPGVGSLGAKTYYANESNHFWDFMYRILQPEYPAYLPFDFDTPREERYQFLLSHGVALWDIVADCLREGSNDSKIVDPTFNNIVGFLEQTSIKAVLCNGEKPLIYLRRIGQLQHIRIPVVKMNSTSSLNPNNTFIALEEWQHQVTRCLNL